LTAAPRPTMLRWCGSPGRSNSTPSARSTRCASVARTAPTSTPRPSAAVTSGPTRATGSRSASTARRRSTSARSSSFADGPRGAGARAGGGADSQCLVVSRIAADQGGAAVGGARGRRQPPLHGQRARGSLDGAGRSAPERSWHGGDEEARRRQRRARYPADLRHGQRAALAGVVGRGRRSYAVDGAERAGQPRGAGAAGAAGATRGRLGRRDLSAGAAGRARVAAIGDAAFGTSASALPRGARGGARAR